MANKDKIIKQAGKYIAKGQLDKAVKELQKAVELDPADVRTLLKLGDVYSKKEDRENATRVYRQVADSYSEQGFFLKAVAVHKQILKHDGDNLEVRLKLAELYEQLGLASEAQAQYQEVARIHDAQGNTQGSLQVLERLVELDSENVASRIKLAEGYSRANRVEEAVTAFAKAAEVLRRQNRIDDYVKVAERLVFHDPDRFDVLKDLARVYLSRGDTKRGLAKLQLCFKAQPREVETLTLLAQAFLELGQTQKTIFVYKELASVHQEQGRVVEAQQIHQRILELDPADADAASAFGMHSNPQAAPQPSSQPAPRPTSGLVAPQAPGSGGRVRLASDLRAPMPSSSPAPASNPVPSPSMSPPPGPSLAPRPPSVTPDIPIEEPVQVVAPQSSNNDPGFRAATPMPPPDTERQIQDIITETDVFVRYGLKDKALGHLRSVFDLDPDNVLAYEKMRDIHLGAGDTLNAAEAVVNIMHAHARTGNEPGLEDARAQLAQLSPGHPLAHGGLPGAIPPRASDDEDLSIDITEDSGVIDMGDLDGAPPEPTFDFEDDAADDNTYGNEATFPPPADLSMPVADPTDAQARPASSPFVADPVFEPFAPSSRSTDLPTMQTAESADAGLLDVGPSTSSDSAPVFDDDEATIAADGLFAAEQAFTERGPAPVPAGSDPFAENVVTEFPDVPPDSSASPFEEAPTPDPTASAEPDLEDELEEAEFYVENGLWDEARDSLQAILEQAPESARALALFARLESESGGDEDTGTGEDLIDDSTSELEAQPFLPEGTAEPTSENALPSTFSGDVDAAFDALGSGTDTVEPPSDPEEQYDMGMVMMETMHFDEAIAAFRIAAQAESRALSALEMIGNCYRQKGQPLDAIDYYSDAIGRGASGPAAVNLMYEIGAAYEEAGEQQRALEWMERCAAQDAGHRDVGARIANLANQLGMPKPNGTSEPPSPGPRSGKKSKISYL